MDPIKHYVDSVVAEAIAGGKTKEEAEALRPVAEEEAKKIVAHPLFQGFEKHAKTRFSEHDNLKKEVPVLKTAAAKLKEIEDAAKSDVQRLTDELAKAQPLAARAKAQEAVIQGIFDDATKDLPPEQKAVIVGDTPEAKLEHYRALVAAGLIGATKKTASPGGEMPGEKNGSLEITEAVRARMTPAQRSAFYLKGGRVKG